jgi:prevent-host-death family protein
MKDRSPMPHQLGSEDARNDLPRLLQDAERGQSTVITRRGRAVAALVPLEAMAAHSKQQPLNELLGSGKGLWGRDSRAGLRKLRDEWNR